MQGLRLSHRTPTQLPFAFLTGKQSLCLEPEHMQHLSCANHQPHLPHLWYFRVCIWLPQGLRNLQASINTITLHWSFPASSLQRLNMTKDK